MSPAKEKKVRQCCQLMVLVAIVFAASAAKAELTIGDPAPKLQVGKWLQGEPVSGFDNNHIYVVEFWATWCGPCKASIPHLNDLWQQFKDKGVVVIGQDVWDNDSDVPVFVKKMGDKMTYRVALDDKSHEPDGFMAEHWWKRKVNDHSIPTAFVINKAGRIAWIGHPAALSEKLLNDIFSDHYDLVQAAAEYNKLREENRKLSQEEHRLNSALMQKKWDAAETALTQLTNDFPKLKLTTSRFVILLGQKKYDDAYRLAESFSDSNPEDVYGQSALAWDIVAQDGLEERFLPLAMKLAERANEAAKGKDPDILDTLARIQFMSGKKSESIVTEQMAIDVAPDEQKASFKAFLMDYKQGKLPEIKE